MEEEELMCSICLENIDSKIKVTLKCNHYFCKPCIDEWLKVKTFCPICRNKEREEEPVVYFLQTEVELSFILSDSDSEIDSSSDSGVYSEYSNSRDVSEENSDIEEIPLSLTLNMLSAELIDYLNNWISHLAEPESHNA